MRVYPAGGMRFRAILLSLVIAVFVVSAAVSFYQLRNSMQLFSSSYSVTSWGLVQLQSEHRRFISSLDLYRLGGLSHEELMFRFDLLWSRFPRILDGRDSAVLDSEPGVRELVQEMFTEVKQLEGWMINLTPQSPLIENSIERMARFEKPLGDLVNREFSDVNRRFVEQDFQLLRMEKVLGISVSLLLGCGLIMAFLLMRQLRRRGATALIDPLTHLPNREGLNRTLHHYLTRLAHEQNEFALLFFDLNRFAAINDSLGRAVGDALLVQLGGRLQAQLREGDRAFRIGGDEFAVMIRGVAERSEIQAMAQRLQQAICQEFVIDRYRCLVGVSVGISLFPDYALSSQELLLQAEIALSEAKTHRIDTIEFYQTWMQDRWHRRYLLMDDLRKALLFGKLELNYQPVVSQPGEEIVSVEALIRWYHPELGEIAAREIMELAELCGLAPQLDSWVLKQACAQLSCWHKDGFTRLKMAVNISRTISLDDLLLTTNKVLCEYQITPSSLIIEFQEIPGEEHTQLPLMEALKRTGVELALDNVGQGYSSLRLLQQLPLTYLKVDSALVTAVQGDPQAEQMLKYLISLTDSMGLTLICGGVETLSLRDLLRHYSRELLLQGYFFSRPVPPQRIKQLLLEQREQKLPVSISRSSILYSSTL